MNDLTSLFCYTPPLVRKEFIRGIAVGSDGRLFTLSGLRLRLYDLVSGELLKEQEFVQDDVDRLRFPVAICVAEQSLILVEINFNTPQQFIFHVLNSEFQSKREWIHTTELSGDKRVGGLSLASDGRILYAATGDCIFCYNIELGKLIHTIQIAVPNPPPLSTDDGISISLSLDGSGQRLVYLQQSEGGHHYLRYISLPQSEMAQTSVSSSVSPTTSTASSVIRQPSSTTSISIATPVNICSLENGSKKGQLLKSHTLVVDSTHNRFIVSDMVNNRIVVLSSVDGHYLECWPNELENIQPPSILTHDFQNSSDSLFIGPSCMAVYQKYLVVYDSEPNHLKLFRIQPTHPAQSQFTGRTEPSTLSALTVSPIESVRKAVAAVKLMASSSHSSISVSSFNSAATSHQQFHYAMLIWGMDYSQFIFIRVEDNIEAVEILAKRLSEEDFGDSSLFEWSWINQLPLDCNTKNERRRLNYGHSPLLQTIWTETQIHQYLQTRFSVTPQDFEAWMNLQKQNQRIHWIKSILDVRSLQAADNVIAMMMVLSSLQE